MAGRFAQYQEGLRITVGFCESMRIAFPHHRFSPQGDAAAPLKVFRHGFCVNHHPSPFPHVSHQLVNLVRVAAGTMEAVDTVKGVSEAVRQREALNPNP